MKPKAFFCGVLLLLQAVYFTSSGQAKSAGLYHDTIIAIRLEDGVGTKNGPPLKVEFDKRVVIRVAGDTSLLAKPDSARIYINHVLMIYKVTYNCPCENIKDTAKKFFTLTCTIGPHDSTWNKWYGFKDPTIKVRVDAGTASRVLTCTQQPNLEVKMYNTGSLGFASVVVILFLILTLFLCFRKGTGMIRDQSAAMPPPYSLSRFQLLWWTFIIISCYMLLFAIRDDFALLSKSTMILLGISAAGTGFSQLVDYRADDTDPPPSQPGKNFFYDVLSDSKGISVHRYQNLIFTFVFGIVFVYKVFMTGNMPDFGVLELSLMGLSTATYVGLKTNESSKTAGAAAATPAQPAPTDNIVG